MRLDRFAVLALPEFTRSQLAQRFAGAEVNGKAAKLSSPVRVGDRIELRLKEVPPPVCLPEPMELDICFEDAHSLVINKPQGLPVHPGAGHPTGTLVNGLLAAGFFSDWPQSDASVLFGSPEPDAVASAESDAADEGPSVGSGDFRPGIVHRLDKETSGLLLVAKDLPALEFYSAAFKNRRVKKIYTALLCGRLPAARGKIVSSLVRDPKNRQRFVMSRDPNRGKQAVTFYETLACQGDFSWVLFFPWTGRTHQLRVHASGLHCPILGDPLYSRRHARFPEATLMLHALALEFLPFRGERRQWVQTPLPARMEEGLGKLGFSLDWASEVLSHLPDYFPEVRY